MMDHFNLINTKKVFITNFFTWKGINTELKLGRYLKYFFVMIFVVIY